MRLRNTFYQQFCYIVSVFRAFFWANIRYIIKILDKRIRYNNLIRIQCNVLSTLRRAQSEEKIHYKIYKITNITFLKSILIRIKIIYIFLSNIVLCIIMYFCFIERQLYLGVWLNRLDLFGVSRFDLSTLLRFGDGDILLLLNVPFASFFCVRDLLTKKKKKTDKYCSLPCYFQTSLLLHCTII